MKLSLDWLREWVDLPDSLEELEDRLTVGGLEIEGIERRGPDLAGFRVGHVVERESHPNADRLSLCQVDLGEGDPVAIVCGAPNVAAGQKVAVAIHGARLPDGTRIKRSKIRGVASNGMICSRRELGLGEDADGILELEGDAPVGAPLDQVLPAGDVILDVAITPNRGDWVSMLGMAREVRAHFGGALRMPAADCSEAGDAASDAVRVAIEDTEGCHRYVARVIRGVRVAASPDWVREKVEAAGLRSINNVVDVTNLVMMEYGQPLHAFDLARLRGGVVRVRAAQPDEKIATLDGQTRQLTAEDLVIADAEGAIAIAGVMGGSESEVGDETRDLLLESAHFHPSRVRRTARRLGLSTDASYRFERGVDRAGTNRAADRAARLIAELTGGQVAKGSIDVEGAPLPRIPEVVLDPARVNRLLGTALDRDTIAALLERVDVEVAVEAETLRCRPPSWRNDIAIPEDLIEEVARVHGYDRIEATLPETRPGGVSEPAERTLALAARDALAGAGLVELMTFSAGRGEDADALGLANDDPRRQQVPIVNPIQAGEPLLRSTLVPSLLRATAQNLAHQVDDLRLFEVARVFRARTEGELPEERLEAVAVLAGSGAEALWERRDVPIFFRAKGVAERVLADLGLGFRFESSCDEPYLHPGASGAFRVGRVTVCSVGELHPETAAHFGLSDEAVALVVLDLASLLGRNPAVPRFREIPRQPRVRRDLAVLLDASARAGEAAEAIRKAGGETLRSVRVFDRYAGKGVPEGRVSIAFRLEFRRADRALTDVEVQEAIDKVVRVLAERFGGELR